MFVGGLNLVFGESFGGALRDQGFAILQHQDPDLQGIDPENICNRGQTGAGVQLEISLSVRAEMFESLDREGRKTKTARFHAFVDAVRSVLREAAENARSRQAR